jgi:5'-nucleotidase
MGMNRRHFINHIGVLAGGIALGASPVKEKNNLQKLTLLHTNDTHSRIDPFPMDGSRYQGLGGVSRRETLIRQIRNEEAHVLLLDAGDFSQGTPYYNLFGGELEIKLMNEMGYIASVPGNHEFDNGAEALAKRLEQARFEMIVSNYGLEDSPLKTSFKPYMTTRTGALKIGILGAGIDLKGYVTPNFYGSLQYLDPIVHINRWAKFLRKEEQCDFVICLSHLGHSYKNDTVSDLKLAAASRDVDVIIGGHTHTFLDKPNIIQNADGKPVVVNQAGWAGIMLGRLDFYFEKNKVSRCNSCKNIYLRA